MLVLVGCDSGGGNGGGENEDESFPEPPGRPSFTATVTGPWAATLSGRAVTSASRDAAGTVIQLQESGGASPVITLTSEAPLRPGHYPIATSEARGIEARVKPPGPHAAWRGVSGQVRIERGAGATIVGRFQFDAAAPDEPPVRISGAFVTAEETP